MGKPTKKQWATFTAAREKILDIFAADTSRPSIAFNAAIEYVHGDPDDEEDRPPLDLPQGMRIGLGDFADGIQEWLKRENKGKR